MGWTVLYIAFGVVALWLLGEVLLQYKARLRWRLLAFTGFLGVVLGVLLPSVLVIIAGAVAFAVGQTYVTLSFRRGFSTGWAIGGNPGASRRRKAGAGQAGPTLEVTEVSYDAVDAYDTADGHGHGHEDPAHAAGENTAVYEPQPLPDDTGQYGIYDTGHQGPGHQDAGQGAGYGTGYEQPQQPAYDPYAPAYEQQQPAYDYGTPAPQQQYAAYSDPYIGTQTYGAGSYDASYGGQQQFVQQGYDQYGGTYGGETPAGGVWVPQQRTDEYGGELPPEQGYYPDNGQEQNHGQSQGNGYDEQYRF